jgi:hypothetical protein
MGCGRLSALLVRGRKRSQYVEQEWRYAHGLARRNFIRPMYWKKPMPAPPAELASIHFRYVPFEK